MTDFENLENRFAMMVSRTGNPASRGLFEIVEIKMSGTKHDVWKTIEDKHFGQCIWQQRHPSGRGMLEGLLHKASGQIMIVEMMFDQKLPSPNSSKPWPDIIGLQVYALVDGKNQTWDGLDAALANVK